MFKNKNKCRLLKDMKKAEKCLVGRRRHHSHSLYNERKEGKIFSPEKNDKDTIFFTTHTFSSSLCTVKNVFLPRKGKSNLVVVFYPPILSRQLMQFDSSLFSDLTLILLIPDGLMI